MDEPAAQRKLAERLLKAMETRKKEEDKFLQDVEKIMSNRRLHDEKLLDALKAFEEANQPVWWRKYL